MSVLLSSLYTYLVMRTMFLFFKHWVTVFLSLGKASAEESLSHLCFLNSVAILSLILPRDRVPTQGESRNEEDDRISVGDATVSLHESEATTTTTTTADYPSDVPSPNNNNDADLQDGGKERQPQHTVLSSVVRDRTLDRKVLSSITQSLMACLKHKEDYIVDQNTRNFDVLPT